VLCSVFLGISSRLTFPRPPTVPYISLGAYITDCRDPSARADCSANLSRDFKRFVLQHLVPIVRSSQGLSICPDSMLQSSVSAAASEQEAHISNVSRVRNNYLSLARARLARLTRLLHHVCSSSSSSSSLLPGSGSQTVSLLFTVFLAFPLLFNALY
jgi:hypothetical protein